MQIPKKARLPQLIEKKCTIDGCEALFQGGPSSKYCTAHRDPKTRVKEKAAPELVTLKNQLVQHEYTNVETVIHTCALEGCKEIFEVKIFPKQYVYPKYCPEHRNEHKRTSHLAHRAEKYRVVSKINKSK
jgi:hypothetical protein